MRGRPSGFSLIEVLVALAVLAIAMTAVLKTAASAADNTSYLRDRSFGHWVAMNRVAEVRLEEVFPSTGERSGSERLGEREWFWTLRIESTADVDLHRLDVTVQADDRHGAQVAILTAFIGRVVEGRQEAGGPTDQLPATESGGGADEG